jgi:plastocyanin domain-containing protein
MLRPKPSSGLAVPFLACRLPWFLGLALLATACKKGPPEEHSADGRQVIAVKVGADGYHPSEARAKAGTPVRLTLTRTTDDGCGQEIVIPSLKVKRELPLNQPVSFDLTMPASGAVTFACGMDMYRGSIVAE